MRPLRDFLALNPKNPDRHDCPNHASPLMVHAVWSGILLRVAAADNRPVIGFTEETAARFAEMLNSQAEFYARRGNLRGELRKPGGEYTPLVRRPFLLVYCLAWIRSHRPPIARTGKAIRHVRFQPSRPRRPVHDAAQESSLTRIEPADPGYDLRYFRCPKCSNADQYLVRYQTSQEWVLLR